jgi:aminoglycoside phosphotransferase (APT) family kinase protein
VTDTVQFRTPETAIPQNWVGLAAYLRDRGMQIYPDFAPRQFAGGYGNLNYLLVINGTEMVLRRPPLGVLPPGANDMAREHRILTALHPAFPLAPACHHLCTDPSVIGAPFILLDFCAGLIIRDRLPPHLDAAKAGPMLSQMLGRLLVDLHAIPVASVRLGNLGRPEGFLERTIAGWAVRAALAVDGADLVPPTAEIVTWLRRELPADQPPTLLHNDFKLDNIVLDPETLAPRAVLDWDMGSRGDPLFDLATLLSYWTEARDPGPLQAVQLMPTAAPGFASRAEMVATYARATGRDVSNFRFYRVLTMFKLAVVFLQLGAQWRRGTSTIPRFAGCDALAADLMVAAHDIACQRAD